MSNLFAPLPQSSANKPLVEFRAGKMTYNSTNNKVTPDKRKGLVQLLQSPDGLLHFSWKDRTTGTVEDDLIIFPEEAIYKKVKQCTTGRVFLLEFKESNRRLFFWMQEAKSDKDDEYLNKINEYINNPPNPEANTPQSSPGSMDQNALFQQMFGGLQSRSGSTPSNSTTTPLRSAPSTNRGNAPTSAPAPTTSSSTPNVGDLQSILSTMGVPSSTANQRPSTSLSQVMNADQIIPIVLSNQSIIDRLLPLLPEERRNVEELQAVLRSPQFHQSLDAFSHALQSGQLGEMLRQFGIQSQATGQPITLEAFLRSLQQQAQQKSDKDKKDDKMDTA